MPADEAGISGVAEQDTRLGELAAGDGNDLHAPARASSCVANMRLWSLHPKYLDSRGLVALWRESLLAQAVLRDETIGYRKHPQLERFRNHPTPLAAISRYLQAVHGESVLRGYTFDRSRIKRATALASLTVTTGQLQHEWAHLMNKLQARSPAHYRKWRETSEPEAHPLFRVRPGPTESWER